MESTDPPYPPRITTKPRNKSVQEGGIIELTCVAEVTLYCTLLSTFLHIEIEIEKINHKITLQLTNTHSATLQGINQLPCWNWRKISNLPPIVPVDGSYEQTWIQMKEDNLAESFVFSLVVAIDTRDIDFLNFINCLLQGSPYPTITWWNNRRLVTVNSRVTLSNGGQHLRIQVGRQRPVEIHSGAMAG